MTAVERIQAAIDKLDKLKADSTPGPWFRNYDYIETGELDPADAGDEPNHIRVAKTAWGTAQISRDPLKITDAALITVLHRTIDAQLAILRDERSRLMHSCPHCTKPWAPALTLADAILGPDPH